MTAPAERIQFTWLLRLRWVAVAGQVLVFTTVELLLGLRLPWLPLAIILAFEVASNVLGAWIGKWRTPTEAWLAALLAVDMLLLTAVLHFTGGALNPFTFLYMVHIALGAATLQPRWAWGLAILGLASFGGLFLVPSLDGELALHTSHSDQLYLHLYGMYVAFGVSALFVVYFVARVKRALAEREAELTAARDLAQRQARFASLATMAAGAAHELGTPLSTIALVARELERSLPPHNGDQLQDIHLIRDQVRRCQTILQQMAAEAGDGVGEPAVEAIVAQLLEPLREERSATVNVRIAVEPVVAERPLRLPVRAVQRALRNVVRNAVQASRAGETVEVQVSAAEQELCVEVRDRGTGMDPTVLARATEPFFTTKPPGEGIGLGLFLAQAIVHQVGGQLELESRAGQGTSARLRLPWDVRVRRVGAVDPWVDEESREGVGK